MAKIKSIKLSELKPNPDNPRFIKDDKFEKLVQSIIQFYKMMKARPIIIDENNVILGGNMRDKALLEISKRAKLQTDLFAEEPEIRKLIIKEEIPAEWVRKVDDLSEDEKKEFIIKDNVGFGDWDWEVLANEWNADELDEWGLDVEDFLPTDKDTAKDDGYEEPENLKIDVVAGDLIEFECEDGRVHRLICGSSLEVENWKKVLQGDEIDQVNTDPPYNVAYVGKTKEALTIENDEMSDGDFYQFLYDFYTATNSHVKSGGAWYVWHADSEGANFRKAMVDAGILFKQCLIWVKNSMVMGRQDYHWQHEPCLYGWKPGAAHGWYTDRKQTTVLNFDRPTRSKEHPTMKPIPLIGYQIGNSSKKGDIIADGFCGSGTTMVAAHQIERVARCCELDPRYCQVIIDRMSKLDEEIVVKINGHIYEPATEEIL